MLTQVPIDSLNPSICIGLLFRTLNEWTVFEQTLRVHSSMQHALVEVSAVTISDPMVEMNMMTTKISEISDDTEQVHGGSTSTHGPSTNGPYDGLWGDNSFDDYCLL